MSVMSISGREVSSFQGTVNARAPSGFWDMQLVSICAGCYWLGSESCVGLTF